jgi:hypothetical protein
MIINTHPIDLTAVAERRRTELLRDAERDRLARLAQGDDYGPPWAGLLTAPALVVLLVLLIAVALQS